MSVGFDLGGELGGTAGTVNYDVPQAIQGGTAPNVLAGGFVMASASLTLGGGYGAGYAFQGYGKGKQSGWGIGLDTGVSLFSGLALPLFGTVEDVKGLADYVRDPAEFYYLLGFAVPGGQGRK